MWGIVPKFAFRLQYSWVEGSTVTLLDTSCSGHSIPELDTSLGGTNDAYNGFYR